MSAKAEPRLPRELEREIFLLALAPFKDYQEITSFMLVARRVRAWFKPLLFAVVNLNHSPHGHGFLRAVEADPTLAVCADVKHLFIQDLCGRSEEEIADVVHTCTNLVGLAIDNVLDNSFLSSVASPHLRYLTACVEHLLASGLPSTNLSTITHLTITDLIHPPSYRETLSDILAASALPALTHLSLRFTTGLGVLYIPFLEDTVRKRPSPGLRILIVHVHGLRPSSTYDPDMAVLQTFSKNYPPLAVMIPNNLLALTILDWENTARGERDLWAAAAEFVDRKRRGLVDGQRWWMELAPSGQ
uniref:F-box domain-containing protein n=1 Tax=Mycena chlorophos TaxID=658473 RepID=A0ABQ0LLD4_MYCCL|nr:predicted protein [Mycena chlorophos]